MLIKILFFEARSQRKLAFPKIDSLVFAVDVTNIFTGISSILLKSFFITYRSLFKRCQQPASILVSTHRTGNVFVYF